MRNVARSVARPQMKSPDLFRDSYQCFDKKTGERTSYMADQLQFNTQPDPEPPEFGHPQERQLTLF